MTFWTVGHLGAAAKGEWLRKPGDAGTPVAGVMTDSRAVGKGQCFVALRGENHDGHAFVQQAVDCGAVMVVVDRGVVVKGAAAVLKVEDTRKALGRMAAAYRDHLGKGGATFIAVCGSNGKTTTVRLVDAALKGGGLRGTASQKSFNNDVGVPTTILSAKEGDRYVLCEVGSNAPGEIDALGAIVRPDVAIITSIGREHLQGFGDIRGVMREEASIGRHVKPGGQLIYAEAGGGGWVDGLVPAGLKRRCVEKSRCVRDVRPVALERTVGVEWTDQTGREWRVPLAGAHNAGNGMLAVWVAEALGVGHAAIQAGLLTAKGPEMRQQVIELAGVTIINDAYNANPESMLASLGTIAELTPRAARRVVVLGDMRELGDATAAAHTEVLAAACGTAGVAHIITIGPSFKATAAQAGHHVERHADLDADAINTIVGGLRAGDAVLLKGSRGMRLERLVPAITARFEVSAQVQVPARGVPLKGAGAA